jgi:gamma-glutamyltranspeptidase / glutathione hydrolase
LPFSVCLVTTFSMSKQISRREMLRLTGSAAALASLGGSGCIAATKRIPRENPHGVIVGEPTGATAGMKVLADGGNAIDAVVTAALVSAIATPARCGLGGYGGHATLALADGKKVVSIDFNTTAPAAARGDMYPLDEKGEVKGRVNYTGWLAAGVPGTLAGLELVLKRYGTRSFREVTQPAIAFARDGVKMFNQMATTLRNPNAAWRRDPVMAKLYAPGGESLKAGELFKNPDLAAMLTTLAERNSADSFYRGDIAQRIADAFKKNNGLVTAADLGAYHARECEPESLLWNDFAIHTVPLTAGGLTIIEALTILRALKWDKMPATGGRVHARLEALRVAWRDRLESFGDPESVNVPVTRLLSEEYAQECADRILATVKAKKPLPLQIQFPVQGGTVNYSCVDRQGNLIALTLTHGSTFGAQVAVEGLGLCLGHGMSRFNPHPGHPNSPGPGKHPLTNMCPSVVLRDGKPVLAIGGAGGVRIPNSIFDVLTNYVVLGASLEKSVHAPRLHCPGALDVDVTKDWPSRDAGYLRDVGFKVKNGITAVVSAAEFNPVSRDSRAVMHPAPESPLAAGAVPSPQFSEPSQKR